MAGRPVPPTRREILEGTAAGLIAAGLPGCDGGEDTATPAPGTIDHVIVVMMENRSFDHYLGALSLEEGRAVDGLSGDMANSALDGTPVSPFHLTEKCQQDPPHGWHACHRQFNNGANDGFVTEHESKVGAEEGTWVMGWYDRSDLPVSYGLADAFCVPDRWFCSVMSSTWPNRFYSHAGTSMGRPNNTMPAGGFTASTVYKQLEAVGEEWRCYYTDLPFMGLLADHYSPNRFRPVTEFFEDVAAGRLPAFTWVDPGFTSNDDHPPHHPGLGQIFLGSVYEALARSPHWERCLLVITYDEHGGFFDHVPPPTTDDDHVADGFGQLGFRVPTLLVGPWVRQGVDSTVYDHTSVLRYVCERWNINPWTKRIAAANSIASALDTESMAAGIPLEAPVLPVVEVPQEELGPACEYGGLFRSAQPELESWILRHLPQASLLADQERMQAELLRVAQELGVIRKG
jgi:phospholipase C